MEASAPFDCGAITMMPTSQTEQQRRQTQQAGADARAERKKRSTNPYASGPQRDDWEFGWAAEDLIR